MKKRFTKTEQEGLKRIADMIRAKREKATNKTDKEKQLCNALLQI